MRLKHILRRIQWSANLHFGRLLSVADQPLLPWHIDAIEGRTPHQSLGQPFVVLDHDRLSIGGDTGTRLRESWMPEIGTSSSMSEDGKRSDGLRPPATAPVLDSTIATFAAVAQRRSVSGRTGHR